MATGTCLPELCACGRSAQRKLAQRRAARPAGGDAEGGKAALPAPARESKEQRAAIKAGEEAARASRAEWEKIAEQKAAAGKNELEIREHMDTAREGSMGARNHPMGHADARVRCGGDFRLAPGQPAARLVHALAAAAQNGAQADCALCT